MPLRCNISLLVEDAAQLLGFSWHSKLLIIHADDLGMCHSVNRATIAALEAGAVSSASVMVPCPCFEEAAEWSVLHPACDLGIHTTLISEWKSYPWGPVSERLHSPGLVNEMGHFWPKNSLLRASPQEIQDEIFAQITRAKRSGLDPTHIDSHMLSVARPEYITAYAKTAREFALPFLVDEYWHAHCFPDAPAAAADVVVVDHLLQAPARLSVDSLQEYYLSVLRTLQPGLSQLIVHPGFDDQELRSITENAPAYGAAWRQADFEIVMSDEFRSAIQENEIQVVNWRMIKSAIRNRVESRPPDRQSVAS